MHGIVYSFFFFMVQGNTYIGGTFIPDAALERDAVFKVRTVALHF